MPRRSLIEYVRTVIGKSPLADNQGIPIVDKPDEIVTQLDASTNLASRSQLNDFRAIAEDRNSQYDAYDDMATDSTIAAALEIYADDATALDEKGRIIWVESDDQLIADAGNRLLDILEIPERAWKHIYMLCKYGDYYLKLYRQGQGTKEDDQDGDSSHIISGDVKVVNDRVETVSGSEYYPPFEEYLEDIEDPATIFDLQLKGKTAGFVEVETQDLSDQIITLSKVFTLEDINIYRPDRIIHLSLGEVMTRRSETVTLDFGNDVQTTYKVKRGKSILYDVYPVEREIQLLEDTLLLNRLTRSSLIRLMEIEVGGMPKKEVPNYLRRMKNLIEQHIAMDKTTGNYKSYQAPGPIDNIIYIPVQDGKGSISVNNLGGDVNIRDIADIDYFNNKRAGALKIPRAYLGEDMEGCLRGDTQLLLLNGQHRSIKYLYENKDEYLGKGIMSCNEDGSLVPTTITNIKLTRKNATFVRVHLDNGKYFDVTEDHLCMLRDGTFQWATALNPGDSLMPMYDRVDSGRRYVWDNKEESWKAQYRLVALHKYGELLKGHQIHHINQIKIDDDFDNLEQISTSDHCKIHNHMLHEKLEFSRKELREKDPEKYYQIFGAGGRAIKGIKRSKETCEKISNALKGKPSNHPFEKGDKNPVHSITEETRKKISDKAKGRKHSEATKLKISNATKGRVVSEETKQKLSENHPDFSGKNNPMYGKSVEWTDSRREEYSKRLTGSGNPCYGKKLCNNGIVNKYISSDILEEFLKNNPDWSLGSLKKNKAPYNHKVVKVEYLYDVVEDAYDIEVANGSHTFILDSGVFVHNSGLSNGGSLTRLSIRYARTIMRIQTAYIRSITTLLNIFFKDKKLDYVNKFKVRMTSPATQEDIERSELINNNIELVNAIMGLLESFSGATQKKILTNLIAEVMKMPDIAEVLEKDKTPDEDIDIEGDTTGGPDVDIDMSGPEGPEVDISDEMDSSDKSEEPVSDEGGFTEDEYSSFEDF